VKQRYHPCLGILRSRTVGIGLGQDLDLDIVLDHGPECQADFSARCFDDDLDLDLDLEDRRLSSLGADELGWMDQVKENSEVELNHLSEQC